MYCYGWLCLVMASGLAGISRLSFFVYRVYLVSCKGCRIADTLRLGWRRSRLGAQSHRTGLFGPRQSLLNIARNIGICCTSRCPCTCCALGICHVLFCRKLPCQCRCPADPVIHIIIGIWVPVYGVWNVAAAAARLIIKVIT